MTACEDGACYPCRAPDRCHVCGDTRPCPDGCEAEDGAPTGRTRHPADQDDIDFHKQKDNQIEDSE